MPNKNVYITNARRTPIGSFMGNFANVSAVELGALCIKTILKDSGIDPMAIEEVILGHVLTGGLGQNTARQSALKAGLPKEIPALSVNKVCGSGLNAVAIAFDAITSGNAEVMLAGGQENMSLAMHAIYARSGIKYGEGKLIDMLQYDGLTDVFSSKLMGITAENVAREFGVSREMQDKYAVDSQQKAAKARDAGKFNEEIIPVEVMVKKQAMIVDKDEGIKGDTNLEILSKLRPAFDSGGSVTAGNSSTINDGAACVMLASEESVKRLGLTPLVRVVSYASSGVDPSIMGIGPIPASRKALKKAGWSVEDLDLIEVNEAFASQSIYVQQQMQFDPAKLNVNGGAIALGHPIGASGARVLVTLIHEMKRRSAKKALLSLCIGGGMGIAMCLENIP